MDNQLVLEHYPGDRAIVVKILGEIKAVEKSANLTEQLAAGMYLFRLTGLKPVVPTPHGVYKPSLKHVVGLALLHHKGASKADLEKAMAKRVKDYCDVWEKPLLRF